MGFDSFAITTWENPTDHLVRFTVLSGDKQIRVDIPPKQSRQVPAEYDDAIRTERRGIVVGGLAPQLVPKGREDVPVHESITKAAEMGVLEERLGRRGAAFSAEALLSLAAERDGRLAAEREKDQLKRRLAELEAKTVSPAAPPDPPKVEPSAAPAPPGGKAKQDR